MPEQAQLLPGTLDLLILKAVSLGPLHGYGVLLRIAQISGRSAADRAGSAVSRAVSPGATGAAESELGHIGQQSPCQVLRTDCRRPQAPARRDRRLEPSCRRDCLCALRATGGSMKLLDSIRLRLAALFRRSEINADMDEELRAHIQLRADDLERSGMAPR